MMHEPKGQLLIAGTWVSDRETVYSEPVSTPSIAVCQATKSDIHEAVLAADRAFSSYGQSAARDRARFLRTIGEEIEKRGEMITATAQRETGLPGARLEGERGRTVGQLNMFADDIEGGKYLDKRHDQALPERAPAPRPDLRLIQRPIGPVAVFGASNFPLAFSVAGGDTASALAAGCPVVVKGHPAHPGTSEIIAQAIDAAIQRCEIDPGVFSLLQGTGNSLGAELVTHPLLCAVGFTGSHGGGRALFDLCANRRQPIPFFGELGSINPIFVLNEAASARAASIAEGWAGSLVLGAGQFCTNPGVLVVEDGENADLIIERTVSALKSTQAQTMLTAQIATAYHENVEDISLSESVETHLSSASRYRAACPNLFSVDGETWLSDSKLHQEVFGPSAIVVRASGFEQMMQIAAGLEGQLACTIHMDQPDTGAARRLVPVLERKAGRLLCNGFPTGVEVSSAMVHGGPYPASTNFGATSVGTMAIRRFLRPVCFQDVPEALLPTDWHQNNNNNDELE